MWGGRVTRARATGQGVLPSFRLGWRPPAADAMPHVHFGADRGVEATEAAIGWVKRNSFDAVRRR